MIIFIALVAFLMTLLGGFFALRFQDKLHLILGFSAGAVIGVAFFDLLPEALELAGTHFTSQSIIGILALGFTLYLILDRALAHHSHDDETHEHAGHQHRGRLGAGSLSFHSFLDGFAVGLAFQVSVAVGVFVAAAVIAHAFSDGINTVNLIMRHGGTRAQALRWLAVDSLAPVTGIALGSLTSVPEHILGMLLAFFCGSFLYIGATDLLPESHHKHPTKWTTIATLVGIGLLFVVSRFASI